ncbi:uncharacterized protein LOC141655007 [Silene latifolia]|uniref:uncharacterized protein LOC141655007 n=1 Tax=Silene latifolia TaxID=37657 RepID=UPI003D77BC91
MESEVLGVDNHELAATEDFPLQCHFWTLYARLVGALSFQYTDHCVNTVFIQHGITDYDRLFQKVSVVRSIEVTFCWENLGAINPFVLSCSPVLRYDEENLHIFSVEFLTFVQIYFSLIQ